MRKDILTGLLLDEDCTLSLGELSRACMVHAEWIIELVDEGILEPIGGDTAHWRFSGPNLQRARTVMRLQRDLGVNLAGAALVLDLMDEIDRLRAHLRALDREC
jgi:chaperone modulatory protein CbpM